MEKVIVNVRPGCLLTALCSLQETEATITYVELLDSEDLREAMGLLFEIESVVWLVLRHIVLVNRNGLAMLQRVEVSFT